MTKTVMSLPIPTTPLSQANSSSQEENPGRIQGPQQRQVLKSELDDDEPHAHDSHEKVDKNDKNDQDDHDKNEHHHQHHHQQQRQQQPYICIGIPIKLVTILFFGMLVFVVKNTTEDSPKETPKRLRGMGAVNS